MARLLEMAHSDEMASPTLRQADHPRSEYRRFATTAPQSRSTGARLITIELSNLFVSPAARCSWCDALPVLLLFRVMPTDSVRSVRPRITFFLPCFLGEIEDSAFSSGCDSRCFGMTDFVKDTRFGVWPFVDVQPACSERVAFGLLPLSDASLAKFSTPNCLALLLVLGMMNRVLGWCHFTVDNN